MVKRIDVDAPNCETCGVERPILRIEKSERLEYVPPKVIAELTEIVIRGPLPYECNAGALKIVRPELPIRPIDRGMPGVKMILSVVIGKFLYHLPHYRQVTKTLKDEDACKSMTMDQRCEYRQQNSSGLMLRLRLLLEQERSNVLPQSAIGRAITYTLNQWQELCRFVDDGHLPIDNNAVEREMKSIATGRKNWLFFGSFRGGRAAAIFYTIISSALRHDDGVWKYLSDILLRLADLQPGELERLLPDVWKRDQKSKSTSNASSSTKRVA